MPRYQCSQCYETLSAAQAVRSAHVRDAVDVPDEELDECPRSGPEDRR